MRFTAFAVVLLFSEVQSQQQCSDSLGTCGGSRASLMQVKSLSQKLQASTSRGASTHAQTLAGFQKYTQELVDQYLQAPATGGFAPTLAPRSVGTVSSEVKEAIDIILSYLDKLHEDLLYFHGQDVKDAQYCAEVPQRCADAHFNSTVVAKIVALESVVDTLKDTHVDCRQELQGDCASPSCPEYHNYRKFGHATSNENTMKQFLPGCAKRGDLAHQAAASDQHELTQFEHCLQPTQEWLDPLYGHYTNCKDAEPITEEQSTSCTDNQVDFEEAHCHMKTWIRVHCENHDHCLEHGRKQCEGDGDGIAACTRISANSQARQADNETAERIRCLLDVLVTPDANRTALLLACHDVDYTAMNEFWQIACAVDVTQSADARCTNSQGNQCSFITEEYKENGWELREEDDACFHGGAYFDTCTECDSSLTIADFSQAPVIVCAYTSNARNGETSGMVSVRLKTTGPWSASQTLFEASGKGAKHCINMGVMEQPTAVELKIHSMNGWMFWKITVDDCVVVEDPRGEGVSQFDDAWGLDDKSSTVPQAREFNVPVDCQVRGGCTGGHQSGNEAWCGSSASNCGVCRGNWVS